MMTEHFDISSPRRTLCLDQLIPDEFSDDERDETCDGLLIPVCVHIPDCTVCLEIMLTCLCLCLWVTCWVRGPRDIALVWVADAMRHLISNLLDTAMSYVSCMTIKPHKAVVAIACWQCGQSVAEPGTWLCYHCRGYVSWQLSLASDDPDCILDEDLRRTFEELTIDVGCASRVR